MSRTHSNNKHSNAESQSRVVPYRIVWSLKQLSYNLQSITIATLAATVLLEDHGGLQASRVQTGHVSQSPDGPDGRHQAGKCFELHCVVHYGDIICVGNEGFSKQSVRS
jgi:hypothetical protein